MNYFAIAIFALSACIIVADAISAARQYVGFNPGGLSAWRRFKNWLNRHAIDHAPDSHEDHSSTRYRS